MTKPGCGVEYVVVVVEDELLVRMAASAALSEAGFQVIDTDHVDWALTYLRARARQVHALFTDVHVPGSMDGMALAHLSRRSWPWIGVLITSGRVRPAAHELPEGSRFLAKPYEHEHVIAHLTELVGA